MKKTMISMIAVVLCAALTGCCCCIPLGGSDSNNTGGIFQSTEKKGVSDTLVKEKMMRHYSYEELYDIADLDIQHDVDTQLHRDCVTLSCVVRCRYEYNNYTSSGIFYYDKATDTWTFDEASFEEEENRRIDDSLLGATFTGVSKSGTAYEFRVYAINDDWAWIRFTYEIDDRGKTTTGQDYILKHQYSQAQNITARGIMFDRQKGLYIP